jgi:hypothetical protein
MCETDFWPMPGASVGTHSARWRDPIHSVDHRRRRLIVRTGSNVCPVRLAARAVASFPSGGGVAHRPCGAASRLNFHVGGLAVRLLTGLGLLLRRWKSVGLPVIPDSDALQAA